MAQVTEKQMQDLEYILGRTLPRVQPTIENFVGSLVNDARLQMVSTAPSDGGIPEGELERGLVEFDSMARFVQRYVEHFLGNSDLILSKVASESTNLYLKGLVEIAKAQLTKGPQVNIQNNNLNLADKLFQIRSKRDSQNVIESEA